MSEQGPPSGADPDASDGAPPPTGAGAPRPARKQAAKKRPATRPPGPGGPAGPGGPSAPRVPPPVDDAAVTRNGIIIIAVTVVLGLLIFARGVNNQTRLDTQASVTTTLPGIAGPPTSDRNAAPTTTIPGSAGTAAPSKSPTTKFAPKDIKVVVANAVDPAKVIAGPVADKLAKASYTVTSRVDVTPASDTTFVYYAADLEAEAKAIAKVLEYPESTVAPMPKTPPTELSGGAQFLVVVGQDHAS